MGWLVPRVHVADAVGADERGAVAVDGLEDAVFEHGSLVCLFAESGGKDDEGTHVLLGRQRLHRVGTHRGRNGQYGQVGVGNVFHVGIGADALYFLFFGVDGTQLTCVAAADEVLQDGPSGLVHIIGCTHHDDARGAQQLTCYHNHTILFVPWYKYTVFIQRNKFAAAFRSKKNSGFHLSGTSSQ